jgi:hypothetical protein
VATEPDFLSVDLCGEILNVVLLCCHSVLLFDYNTKIVNFPLAYWSLALRVR